MMLDQQYKKFGMNRQGGEGRVMGSAGLFEPGYELGAAVDLDAFDGEREGGHQELVEEVLGAASAGGRSRRGFAGNATDGRADGVILAW